MRLLIDTHIFLWWDRQPAAIARPLYDAIADGDNAVYVSAASVWEIAIKRANGKLEYSREIVAGIGALGFEVLPIGGRHAEHAGGLPRHHRDPFDRLIVAQAYLEGMMLGTQDAQLRPYGIAILGLDRT